LKYLSTEALREAGSKLAPLFPKHRRLWDKSFFGETPG
jgi:hypothetical protein